MAHGTLLTSMCGLSLALFAVAPLNAQEIPQFKNGVGMTFIRIPRGSFEMGRPQGPGATRTDASPPHTVTLTDDFYLSNTEVTQKQWLAVMGTQPWKGQKHVVEGDDFAASYISWDLATEFCGKLTDLEKNLGKLTPGSRYELPSEAQWEYAARTGLSVQEARDQRGPIDEVAWWGAYWAENGTRSAIRKGTEGTTGTERYPHEVARLAPNQWGLYDMYGNVNEWCDDWYAENYYQMSPEENPQGPEQPSIPDHRVMRGGSWACDPLTGAIGEWARSHGDRSKGNAIVGFRVALIGKEKEEN
jgi:formylglycine-generating enzyme required for sulfatase activity